MLIVSMFCNHGCHAVKLKKKNVKLICLSHIAVEIGIQTIEIQLHTISHRFKGRLCLICLFCFKECKFCKSQKKGAPCCGMGCVYVCDVHCIC